MEIIFLVIAIVFLVLWQLEKRKSTTVKNLEVERAAARSYVEDRKADGLRSSSSACSAKLALIFSPGWKEEFLTEAHYFTLLSMVIL